MMDFRYEHLIAENDIKILRDIALKVRELSERPIETIKREKWVAINELKSRTPVVFADPENGWHEIIRDDMLVCESEQGRIWEFELRKMVYWGEEIKDDKVIEANFNVPYIYTDSGWGLDIQTESTGDGGAYHIIPVIISYEEDFGKIKFPDLLVDYAKTKELTQLANEIFKDILTVSNHTNWWWSLGMTWDYINLRGLDHLMMDLILEPEWVHKTMDFLMNGYLKRMKFLEDEGLLFNNNYDTYVGSGGFGYTQSGLEKPDELDVKLNDMWGFAESQETVGVRPSMFNEFILPYQLKLLEKFKLNCYGCCEPIDTRWDYVKSIPNLRRVSASPWADKAKMATQLEGKYIISVKGSPTPLARFNMNEEVVRNEIKDILKDTLNQQVEIIMKDNHTLGNNPNNIVRWVEIMREEIKEYYD